MDFHMDFTAADIRKNAAVGFSCIFQRRFTMKKERKLIVMLWSPSQHWWGNWSVISFICPKVYRRNVDILWTNSFHFIKFLNLKLLFLKNTVNNYNQIGIDPFFRLSGLIFHLFEQIISISWYTWGYQTEKGINRICFIAPTKKVLNYPFLDMAVLA